jgi:hypothetical protein
MKLRARRLQRTRPRLYTVAGSVACEPYTVNVCGFEMPMDTKRVKLKFWKQHASHADCFRKLSEAR